MARTRRMVRTQMRKSRIRSSFRRRVELQLSDYASLFSKNERTGGLQQSFPGDGDFGHGRDGLVQ